MKNIAKRYRHFCIFVIRDILAIHIYLSQNSVMQFPMVILKISLKEKLPTSQSRKTD